MGEVDVAFVQAIEHRPKPIIFEAQGIPIIDLSSIKSLENLPNDYNVTQEIASLVTKVGEACEKWGFFQVINHGVPLEKLEKLEIVAREFFALPLEEKRKVSRDESNPLGYYDTEHTKNVRDWKQVFDFSYKEGGFFLTSLDEPHPKHVLTPWPANPPNMREVAGEYAREVEKLAFKLLELIALSLGLPSERLNNFFDDSVSFIRLNHYPTCPSPHLALGVGRHKDAGALTILAQDSVGGLQVRRKSDGEWVNVKPTPGAYIINVGDIIQVWSNDKYESVEHRVMVNPNKDRLSIPFFFNPANSVMVKPLEELLDGSNHGAYKEYNWGSFYASRMMSNYQKLHVENIQISHFKITK